MWMRLTRICNKLRKFKRRSLESPLSLQIFPFLAPDRVHVKKGRETKTTLLTSDPELVLYSGMIWGAQGVWDRASYNRADRRHPGEELAVSTPQCSALSMTNDQSELNRFYPSYLPNLRRCFAESFFGGSWRNKVQPVNFSHWQLLFTCTEDPGSSPWYSYFPSALPSWFFFFVPWTTNRLQCGQVSCRLRHWWVQ